MSEPPLYNAEELETIAGLGTISKSSLFALLSRILDGSRFFEFKVTLYVMVRKIQWVV
jgi:hypothetical protein